MWQATEWYKTFKWASAMFCLCVTNYVHQVHLITLRMFQVDDSTCTIKNVECLFIVYQMLFTNISMPTFRIIWSLLQTKFFLYLRVAGLYYIRSVLFHRFGWMSLMLSDYVTDFLKINVRHDISSKRIYEYVLIPPLSCNFHSKPQQRNLCHANWRPLWRDWCRM